MCRGDPSAHGRISALLSAGVFPHDLADLPRVGPGRMCSTVRPAPMLHSGLAAPRSVAAPMGLVDPDNPVHPVAWTAGWAAGARSDRRPRSLVCVGRRLTPVRFRSSPAHPMRPMCLSWVRFIPCGTCLRGEKWCSGRIVPLRTRPCCRQNRAITRKLPDASGAPTRTILPERQNRGPAGSERPSTPRTPLMRFAPGPLRGQEEFTQRGAGARRWACHRRARRGGGGRPVGYGFGQPRRKDGRNLRGARENT